MEHKKNTVVKASLNHSSSDGGGGLQGSDRLAKSKMVE